MAEFLPKYLPGQVVTRTASATITAKQLVAVSGVNTVAPAGANSVAVVGTAAFDAASGETVTIYTGGVHELVASGAIGAGVQVVAAANGAVSAAAAVTTPTAGDVTTTRAVIGFSWDAASGNKVTVQFR